MISSKRPIVVYIEQARIPDETTSITRSEVPITGDIVVHHRIQNRANNKAMGDGFLKELYDVLNGQKKYYTYLSAATIQHDVNGNFADGMLMGNLTADVTTRSTQNGNNIANFTVASNRSYQKDGQWVDVPSFVAVAASGKLAEFIASKFHKGDPIMVAGTLSSYSYKNKDGENRTSYTVWADKAAFASRGKDTAQNSTPAPAATPASAPAPSAPTYGEYGADEFDAVEEEDDLPF